MKTRTEMENLLVLFCCCIKPYVNEHIINNLSHYYQLGEEKNSEKIYGEISESNCRK